MPRTPIWILPAVILVLALGGGWWLWKSINKPPLPIPSVEEALPKQYVTALKASKEKKADKSALPSEPVRPTVQFNGNGREQLRVIVNNKEPKPFSLDLAAGTVFQSSRSRVVLLQTTKLSVEPGSNKQLDLKSAAVSVANEIGEESFTQLTTSNARVTALVNFLEKRPEVPFKVAQTAILALAENAPAEVFAKFKRLNSDLPTHYDPIAFKVDNSELIAALTLLRESGGADANLSLASDPQLKIEALLDSQSHDLALSYYGITPASAWSFWKQQLLAGPPSLRHYALYGISRYYPDVALEMMPKWAKETRMDPIFRLSAVRSLALTGRPEAVPILQKLQQELAAEAELTRAAERAVQFLVSQPKLQ